MVLAIDDLKTLKSGEPLPSGLGVTKRIIQVEGVQLFKVNYFHPELRKFISEVVEIRYDIRNLAKIQVVLPDYRTVEAETIAVFANDSNYLNGEAIAPDELQFPMVEASRQLLIAACYQALEMKQIFTELSDPFLCVSQRLRLQGRFAEIEKNIREAIEKGGVN